MYQIQVQEMTKENELTDYEMQLWLHKQGHILYDEKMDNEVDMNKLCELAESHNFLWFEKEQLWVR